MIEFFKRLFRRKPKHPQKWRLFFDQLGDSPKRIELGVYEGTAGDAAEECYMRTTAWMFSYFSNQPEAAAYGNYGIEEVKDEPVANG